MQVNFLQAEKKRFFPHVRAGIIAYGKKTSRMAIAARDVLYFGAKYFILS
jgi:hypothetical protein